MQRGVSLIEVMIGLTIVALLLAAGVPSFSKFIQNTQIRNAAEAIQNGLSLARSEAVRRNTNVQFVLTDAAGGAWTVGCAAPVDMNGDGVEDPGDCPASIQARTAGEGSIKATVAAVTTTLSFNGLGKVTSAGTPASFIITKNTGDACPASGSARCLKVVVTSGGQIRMCDPALSSSDPQACP